MDYRFVIRERKTSHQPCIQTKQKCKQEHCQAEMKTRHRARSQTDRAIGNWWWKKKRVERRLILAHLQTQTDHEKCKREERRKRANEKGEPRLLCWFLSFCWSVLQSLVWIHAVVWRRKYLPPSDIKISFGIRPGEVSEELDSLTTELSSSKRFLLYAGIASCCYNRS